MATRTHSSREVIREVFGGLFDFNIIKENQGYLVTAQPDWAKIDIEFPTVNENGECTPIRGLFVTLDSHFSVESSNSEINAWTNYVYKNVAKYNYNHGVKESEYLIEDPITLQPGNKGTIYIKDAHNLMVGDIIGLRVHAVNLDGTLTDPDGRAFYVIIEETNSSTTGSTFTAETEEGVEILFQVTSDTEHTCQVGMGSVSAVEQSITGDYTIPSVVTVDGTEYAVTGIAPNAFKGCTDMTSLTIPESITSIGENAFAGCTGLKEIFCFSSVPIDLSTMLARGLMRTASGTVPTQLEGIDFENCILYVPFGTSGLYREAEGWCLFRNIHELPDGKLSLGDVNCDSEVNNLDVNLIVSHVAGKFPSSFVWDAADINEDGEVDILDVAILIGLLCQ